MGPETTVYSAAVVFVAYLVRGVAGFGSGLVAVPLLTLFSPITAVVPVVVSLDYIGSASQSVRNLQDIAWREQVVLLPFMLIGILGGLYLLTVVPTSVLAKILGVFVIALSTVQSFTLERDAALARGQSTQLGAYEFRFEGLGPVEGPNYDGVRGDIAVQRNGWPLIMLHPEKRRYWVQGSVMTEAAIHSHFGTDVFVALGEDLGAGRWSLRFQVRPLVDFLWIGAFIMALGGALAASDRRYRTVKSTAALPAGAAGEPAA